MNRSAFPAICLFAALLTAAPGALRAGDDAAPAPAAPPAGAEMEGTLIGAAFWGLAATATAPANAPDADPKASPFCKLVAYPAVCEALASRYAEIRPLGEHSCALHKEYDAWLAPTGEFFLKADSLGVDDQGVLRARLHLWQGNKVAAKLEARIAPERPLIIEGPAWRGGRLIIAVFFRPPGAKDDPPVRTPPERAKTP